ncbi:MAG: 2-amino-4-hydroxy-6-hydroxymethyldihydropteridine diphosphokinase [Desulfobacteraceae bacterium]|nr:MAG: 2-amino-4-hydroxy-6-hydroxymethyldihydropteridine diphosphokinase [Desulfobacteraceae bacterium]
MPEQYTAYLSIGSNRGSKADNLDQALAELEKQDHTRIITVSPYYRTEPRDYADQDWFVNAVVKIRTILAPDDLLGYLKSIEKRIDTEGKPFRYGPRVIDLDIVLYDTLVLRSEELDIPHPKMHERGFVLQPLCDIDPHILHPVLNKTCNTLLDEIKINENQGIIPFNNSDLKN